MHHYTWLNATFIEAGQSSENGEVLELEALAKMCSVSLECKRFWTTFKINPR
jgi:hypothetical protein